MCFMCLLCFISGSYVFCSLLAIFMCTFTRSILTIWVHPSVLDGGPCCSVIVFFVLCLLFCLSSFCVLFPILCMSLDCSFLMSLRFSLTLIAVSVIPIRPHTTLNMQNYNHAHLVSLINIVIFDVSECSSICC